VSCRLLLGWLVDRRGLGQGAWFGVFAHEPFGVAFVGGREQVAASTSPVSSRAATMVRAGIPATTSRRSVSRAAATWKYIATPARNPAAHPAVAVSTGGPPPAPPSSFAASASGPAATSTNVTGTRTRVSRLTGLRA